MPCPRVGRRGCRVNSYVPGSEIVFGFLVVLTSRFDVSIELWGEVVQGLFGWVLPLLLASFVLESPSVASLLFSDIQAVLAGNDLVIIAQILNWVVNWVSKRLSLSLVLVASRGVADGVALSRELDILNWRQDPFTVNVLLLLQVVERSDHLWIKRFAVIVDDGILGLARWDVVPLVSKLLL